MQVFHPATNSLSRITLRAAVFLVLAAMGAGSMISTSDYVTRAHVIRPQPVEFSHQHHVAGLGIDCRYCHLSAATSAYAGFPSTEICMNCHSVVWADSPKLALVRESYRTNQPLLWTRVTDLPDFVRFDHSIHVQKGVACQVCHGRVDQMPLAWREHAMTMRWCLDCHRSPEPHLRPRSEVFQMVSANASRGARDSARDGTRNRSRDERAQTDGLPRQYQVRHPTDCSACHH